MGIQTTMGKSLQKTLNNGSKYINLFALCCLATYSAADRAYLNLRASGDWPLMSLLSPRWGEKKDSYAKGRKRGNWRAGAVFRLLVNVVEE